MKFLCYFYISIFIIIRKIWVRCTSDFEFRELKYLSEKLDTTECLKLLDGVYERIAANKKTRRFENIQKEIHTHLKKSWMSPKYCFFQLQNWNDHFPGEGNIEGRQIVKDVLLSLGRPDLVKYLKKNQKHHFINHLKKFEKLYKNNEFDQASRYQNGRETNQNKYPRGNNHLKKFDLDKIDNINDRPTQVVVNGEIYTDNEIETKNHDVIKNKIKINDFDVYWIILITVLALLIMSICASGIFFIYRKNCNRLIKGRLCQEWALNREKDKFNICCCGKRQETSRKAYSDLDMESGWSRRCSKCWINSKGDNIEKSRLKQETSCVQKCKKLRKKKLRPKTKEKLQKKEERKVSRNKCLEREMKSRKCQRSAISEPSRTDYKEMQNKIIYLPKNSFKCYQCNCTSEETDFIIATRKDKKKEKCGWSSGWTSPQFKEKKIKESKNTEKLFQYDSSSPCSRKTCEWKKITKGKRHGKNSV